MDLSASSRNILETIKKFEIIDAHEHLHPEKARLAMKVDVFTLFSHFTKVDLLASGYPYDKDFRSIFRVHDAKIPIEKRWEMFSPYLKLIKYGSYARPAFIAAKEFYGFDDVNEQNYKKMSKKMEMFNSPGIYHRILREKCKILRVLTQAHRVDFDLSLLVPIMDIDQYAAIHSKEIVEKHSSNLGVKVADLDDYLDLIFEGMKIWKSKGVVGIKIFSQPYVNSVKSKARKIFNDLMQKSKVISQKPWPSTPISPSNHLYSFLMEKMLEMASNLDLVVSVHAGMWGDFRLMDPQHMIPIFQRHPKTRFDIYHMGIPYVRETAIIGKNFPNVWLNLCWCHVISPVIARQAMNELIDLVPINKIIAFGGDYSTFAVEKIYGHLVMARENIAKVLGERVQSKLMSESEATEIAKRWFYNNPKELYRLS